ncbi:F-box protein At3g07870-like [Rhodamnia argentea]|uniref:F-box protein At3g07870-like n=1 Tax=Rhodamnia argentea TaxID=178133 RepID=A0A8B8PH31_9MYRT|nr:F-box protein At3g07870-like [Rhodamnia argentea]
MALLSGVFPSIVMVEILACLPARSPVQFRCVSKSWRSLLSEPYFMMMWLNRSATSLLGYNSRCCNKYLVHGFGYEPNAWDCKVVRITYSRGFARPADSPIRPWLVEVYSVGKDTWTSLGRPNFTWMIHGNSRAFVNGSTHWLAAPTKDAPYDSIVAFHMEKESFGEVIQLPQLENLSQFSLNPRGKATLSVSFGSLALIAFSLWNREESGIWVMEEHGVANTWTKQHHIVLPIGSTVQAALGLPKHGKILLRTVDEKLVCCDVEDAQISEIGIQGGHPESSFDVIEFQAV